MKTVLLRIGAAILLASCYADAAAAQSAPEDAVAARCRAGHFGQAFDQCRTVQLRAAADFAPIADFIAEGNYVVQMMALGHCLESTNDQYGQDYVGLAACYDETVTKSCDGNATCLSNSTIAGIQQHIRNGTKP